MIWLLPIIAIDQLIKIYLWQTHRDLLFLNPGVAFGLGSWWWVLIGMTLVATLWWQEPLIRRVLLVIILVWLSNVVDRLYAGGVIDYFRLGNLQFNLADILIVGLVAWLVYCLTIRK